MSTDVRRCWSCREVLPITAFSRNGPSSRDTKYRKKYICKPCNTARRDAWRASLSPAEQERQRALQRKRQARSARAQRERQYREDAIATLLTMLHRLQAWGMSIPEIARRAGVNPNTLYRWRADANRRHINRETVDKVSRVYLREIGRQHDDDRAA